MHIHIIVIANPDLLQTHLTISVTNAEMEGTDRKLLHDNPLNVKIEPMEDQALTSTVRAT
jgi:hypothetical protein